MMESVLQTKKHAIVGYSDDISAVKLPTGDLAVLKTDMMVGSTDMPRGMTLRQAARKAVVANVSDLAAKGARPLAGLVALGLPARLTAKNVHEIAAGLRDASREYHFPIVGGDTNESKDLVISIMLFAVAKRKELILRTGAKSGDIVAVTGLFGDTSAGLKGILEKRIRPKRLAEPLYSAVFRPRAELELGLKLSRSGALSASIDSSDGLAWSLHELSDANKIGITIDHVPVSRAAAEFASRYRYDAKELALYGGEEYHLVVTVKKNRFAIARRAAQGNLIPIGTVTKRFRGVHFFRAGRTINIPRKGWQHFKT
jgi:thiamine-monophosphate kinase